jgi:hypothetical protein
MALVGGLTFFLALTCIPYVVRAADGSGANTVSPNMVQAGTTTSTLVFVFTAAEAMDTGEVTVTAPSGWSAPQGTAGTAGYTTVAVSSGMIGTVLDNAESTTGWVASTACTNGFTTDASVKFEGGFSFKCANGDQTGTDRFYKTISASDWSAYTTVSFWIRASVDVATNRLYFGHDESSSFATPSDVTVGPLTANTWTHITLTLSGTTAARDAVQSFGFIYRNSPTAFDNVDIYVDDFLIGPGLPTFSGSGGVSARLLQLTGGQTMTLTYGAGGGVSGATAPLSNGTNLFTTKTRTMASGVLTQVVSSPTVTVSGGSGGEDGDTTQSDSRFLRIPPLINLRQVPSPLGLPDGPGPVTSTYTVTNPGRTTMTDISLIDSSCPDVRFISGDENGNASLEISETWIYECTQVLSKSIVSYAKVRGVGHDLESTDTAIAEVIVGEAVIFPIIHLTAVPEPFTVPLGGGSVTYTYAVTNPGTEAIDEVVVAGDACSAVTYIGGDVNQNELLEPGETWAYQCTAITPKTTVSTAIATGKANGHTAIDPAIVAVIVAASTVPEPIGSYGAADALARATSINGDKGLVRSTGKAAPCESGSLIRLPDDEDPATSAETAVYYCGEDGKRHVFPDLGTYMSWYSDFSGVRILPESEMRLIPIGENVTYRPGMRLVKAPSDPKVYAVEQGGKLRWVIGEAAVQQLYGPNWRASVQDISESLFSNYTIGPSITLAEVIPWPATAPTLTPAPMSTSPSVCTNSVDFTRLLSSGSVGDDVRGLQSLLQCLGYFPENVAPSGYFGPMTEGAVKKFQTANGIDPVGYVGPATREALNRY